LAFSSLVASPANVSALTPTASSSQAVVRSGTVSVVQRDACTPAPVGPERSFYVADATPYEMRNDGPDPVVLTRSELLAPDAEERRPVEPAC
jgi:hypothetical protein